MPLDLGTNRRLRVIEVGKAGSWLGDSRVVGKDGWVEARRWVNRNKPWNCLACARVWGGKREAGGGK